MRWNLRSPLAVLCGVLLLWQATVAPLAHASAVHSADHSALVEEVRPTPAAAADVEAMPCHGHEASASEAMPNPRAHSGVHATVPLGGEPSHDSEGHECCGSLACQCACVHASLAPVSLPISARVVPAHATKLGCHLPLLRARVFNLFKPPI